MDSRVVDQIQKATNDRARFERELRIRIERELVDDDVEMFSAHALAMRITSGTLAERR